MPRAKCRHWDDWGHFFPRYSRSYLDDTGRVHIVEGAQYCPECIAVKNGIVYRAEPDTERGPIAPLRDDIAERLERWRNYLAR